MVNITVEVNHQTKQSKDLGFCLFRFNAFCRIYKRFTQGEQKKNGKKGRIYDED